MLCNMQSYVISCCKLEIINLDNFSMTNPNKQNAARREVVNFCCLRIIGTSFTPQAGQRTDLS